MRQFLLRLICKWLACTCFFYATGIGNASAATAETRRIMQVGPHRMIHSLAAASTIVRDGETIEVDAGDYVGDVAIWDKKISPFAALVAVSVYSPAVALPREKQLGSSEAAAR